MRLLRLNTTFDKRNNFLVPESQAFEHLVMGGQVLLLLWLAYVGAIAFTMCSIATPKLNADDRLKRLFRDLKHSFLVFVFAVFFAEMIHPDFGFIDAQIDLTLLTIAIPAMHVTLGMCVQNAMQSSGVLFFVGLPISAALAGVSCYYSKAGGQGSFFIVTLHVFTKMLQFFGADLDVKRVKKVTSGLETVKEGADQATGSEGGDRPAYVTRPSRKFTIFGMGGGDDSGSGNDGGSDEVKKPGEGEEGG